MKSSVKTKFIVGGILTLFMIISVSSGFAQNTTQKSASIELHLDFSAPVVTHNNGFNEVNVIEADGFMTKEGCPMMPVFSKTFEFPLGTHITSVDLIPSVIQSKKLEKQIRPVPSKQRIGDMLVPIEGFLNEHIYNSEQAYPSEWYTVTTGAGLNKNNDHVLFVSCHITPARYLPSKHLLQYSTHFTLFITYDPVPPQPTSSNVSSLVIITPSEFSSLVQPLVEHKKYHGVSTTLVTLDEIYASYGGRDDAEKIKYFIYHEVNDNNIRYVLLVGDIKKLPIRTTYAARWEENLLSDLYYADVNDANGSFCSWDSNMNNQFGETSGQEDDIDGVDLYADVHVGRLPCTDATEVTTIVNKIITYEEETFHQTWFKRIVLAGGDTFPPCRGSAPFVYEGEITNTKVGETLPAFTQTYLWTSKRNLHPWSFNRAINQGTGFVSYAGHGFEHGWGTYRPNALSRKSYIWYFTPYTNGLKNGNKLPIIFFDACLTAKLDFNFTNLKGYFGGTAHLLTRLFNLSENPSVFYPCFAGVFLTKEDGGAIATIGSTRTAYTYVDSNGVYAGAGYLDVHFFNSYTPGVTVGEMLTGAQNAYIQNVGLDYFTIEEFILLGDPSLMVGGYQ